MKKILLSFAGIVVIAGAVTGATIAFYNDTETSTNNVFTAGSVDLKVDHTYAEYNSVPCVGNCTETGNDLIVNGGFEFPEPVANGGQWQIYPENPLDEVPGWDVVSGAGIEIQENVAGAAHGGNQKAELDSHGANSQTVMKQVINTVPGQQYRLKFWHSPRPNNGPDTDNAIELYVLVTSNSGTIVNDTIGQPSFSGSGTVWTEYVYNFIALDTQTTVQFGDAGSEPDTLGGYLDDVSMFALNCSPQNPSFPNGGMCSVWGEKDLGDDENVAVEPELTALPTPDTTADGIQNGELSDELEFFIWEDLNGNNVYDSSNNEPVLVKAGTPFNQIPTEMVTMSLTGNAPITLVGMNWCAGTQTGPQNTGDATPVACDGNGMGDIAQTDKMLADFVAYAVQHRNNVAPDCANIGLPLFANP